MALNINEVTVAGRLGRDPEIRQAGSTRNANLRIAVSESWKDKATGEWKEKTEWVSVVIWNEHLVSLIERRVKKGTNVWVRGQMQTRSYKSNNDQKDVYVTEVVVRGFSGNLLVIDPPQKSQGAPEGNRSAPAPAPSGGFDLDGDDIPF